MAERANHGADDFMMSVQRDERQAVLVVQLEIGFVLGRHVRPQPLEAIEEILGVLEVTPVSRDDFHGKLFELILGNAVKKTGNGSAR